MRFLFGLLAIAVFIVTACQQTAQVKPKPGTSFCARATGANCDKSWADRPDMQIAIDNIAGLWMWTRTSVTDSKGATKVSTFNTLNTPRIRYCIGNDGTIKIFGNDELYCSHCYNLERREDSLFIVTTGEPSPFCEAQVYDGFFRTSGDSLYFYNATALGKQETLFIRDLISK